MVHWFFRNKIKKIEDYSKVDCLWNEGRIDRKSFRSIDSRKLVEIKLVSQNEEVKQIISEELILRYDNPWLKKYLECILDSKENCFFLIKKEFIQSLEAKDDYIRSYLELIKFYLDSYDLIVEEEIKEMIDYCATKIISKCSQGKCHQVINLLKVETRSFNGEDVYQLKESLIDSLREKVEKKS